MIPVKDDSALTNHTWPYSDMTEPGDGRSSGTQAVYQLLALNITLAISIVTGILTGVFFNFVTACVMLQ